MTKYWFWAVLGIALLAGIIWDLTHGFVFVNAVVSWCQKNWKVTYLVYTALMCAVLAAFFWKTVAKGHGTAQAAATWGSIGFALLLLAMLGAAQNARQFFVSFASGALGASLGYLAGVWLAPSSETEESRFAKAQSMLATLFAGAIGTKLLSLWDTVTKGELGAPLFRPELYIPFLSLIVGFALALACFYTLRTFGDGSVRVTATPKEAFVPWTDAKGKQKTNGVRPDTNIQFAGGANFFDDVSVSWGIQSSSNAGAAPPFGGSIDACGKFKAPDQQWMTKNAAFLDWFIVATSNRDHSKSASYEIHLLDPVAVPGGPGNPDQGGGDTRRDA